MKPSKQYSLFINKLSAFVGETPQLEFNGIPNRRFAFDIAFVHKKVAIEINGGVYKERTAFHKGKGRLVTVVGGRHNSGQGYINDLEKLNLAQINGWVVLQYTPEQLNSIETFEQIKTILNQRKCCVD